MDKVARHTSPGISYALSYGFSYRFLSSLPSHRFSIPFSVSSLPFNVGGGLFVGNALREREREKEKEGRKKGSHLKLETRENGRVVAWDPVLGLILHACVSGMGMKKGKGVSHGGNFCSRLVARDLFFGVWKDLDRSDLVNIYLVRYSVFLETRDFDLKISLQFSFGAKKSKREEKYRNGSIKFNGHNTGRFVIKQMTID